MSQAKPSLLDKLDDWGREMVARFPFHLRQGIARRYLAIRGRALRPAASRIGILDDGREREANLWLRNLALEFPEYRLALGASDGQLCEFANERAKEFDLMSARGASVDDLAARCAHYGVELPYGETEHAIARRLGHDKWWRRALRRHRVRAGEALAIELGMVCKQRQLYVSNDTLAIRTAQKARNSALLDGMIAVNELGQSFTLTELAEKGVSNPKIRRAELICRMAGMETIAQSMGLAGEFITLTTPSRFHAVKAKTGRANPKYAGTTPRDAADYLQTVWGRITAQLAREGIRIYGLRVAEPHHDGTPHYHGLFFLRPEKVARFRAIVACHAVREDRDELGLSYALTDKLARAQAREMKAAGSSKATLEALARSIGNERAFWREPAAGVWAGIDARINFKAIDWNRGTATGYIIKYIAKNIDGERNDGESVGIDFDASDDGKGGNDTRATAQRVNAFASAWGIRQFQQVGGPPVGIWRELRRWKHDGAETVIQLAAMAANDGNWGRFVELMGGWEAQRKDMPLKTVKTVSTGLNIYGEARADTVAGVVDIESGMVVATRPHDWTISRGVDLKAGAACTWTRVNNSTEMKFSSLKPAPMPTAEDCERWENEAEMDRLMRAIQPEDDGFKPAAELAQIRQAKKAALDKYRFEREINSNDDGTLSSWVQADIERRMVEAEQKSAETRQRVAMHAEIKAIGRNYQQPAHGRGLEVIAQVKRAAEHLASRVEKPTRQKILQGVTLQTPEQQAATLARLITSAPVLSNSEPDAPDLVSAEIAKVNRLIKQLSQAIA